MKRIIFLLLLLLCCLLSFSEIEQEDITKNPLREVTTYTTTRIKDKAILDLTIEKFNIRGIMYSKLEEGNVVFEINKTEGITPKYLVTTSIDLIPRDIKVNGKAINRDKNGKNIEFVYKEDTENLKDNIYIEAGQNFTSPLYISKLDSKTGKLLEIYEYKEIPKTRSIRSVRTINPGNTTLNSFYLGKMIPGEILEKDGFPMNGGQETIKWFNGVDGGFENKSMTLNKRDTSLNVPVNATVSMWWDVDLITRKIKKITRFEEKRQLSGVTNDKNSHIVQKIIYANDWRTRWWTSVPDVKLSHGFRVSFPAELKNVAFGLYGITSDKITGRKLYTSDGNPVYQITTPNIIDFLVQRDPRAINLKIVKEQSKIIQKNGVEYSVTGLNNLTQHGYSFRFNYQTTGKDSSKGIYIDPYEGLVVPASLPSGSYEINVRAQIPLTTDSLQIGGQLDKVIIEYIRQSDSLALKELDLRSFLSSTWGRWKDIFSELGAVAGSTNKLGQRFSFKEAILSSQKFDLKQLKKIKLFKDGVSVAESSSYGNGRVQVDYEDLDFGVDGGELLGEFFINKKAYSYLGDAEYTLEFLDSENRIVGRMNTTIIKDRGINMGSVTYEIDDLLLKYMKSTGAEQFFIGMSDNMGSYPQNKYKDLIVKGSGSYINNEITVINSDKIIDVTETGTSNLGYKEKTISRKIDTGITAASNISYNKDGSLKQVFYYRLLKTSSTPLDFQEKILFNLKTLNESNSYRDSFYTGFKIDDGRVYEMKYEFAKSTKTSYKEASYTLDTTNFQVGKEYIFDLSTGEEQINNETGDKKQITKSGEAFEYSLLGNSSPNMSAFTVEDISSKLSEVGLENYRIKLEKDEQNRKTLLKIQKNSNIKIDNKSIEGKINFYDITVGKIALNISDKGPSFELIDNGELDFGILTYDPYNTYIKGEKVFSVKNPNSYPITFTLQNNSGVLKNISNNNNTIPVENLKIIQDKKNISKETATFLLEGYAKPYPNMVSGEYRGEIMIDITIDTTNSN